MSTKSLQLTNFVSSPIVGASPGPAKKGLASGSATCSLSPPLHTLYANNLNTSQMSGSSLLKCFRLRAAVFHLRIPGHDFRAHVPSLDTTVFAVLSCDHCHFLTLFILFGWVPYGCSFPQLVLAPEKLYNEYRCTGCQFRLANSSEWKTKRAVVTGNLLNYKVTYYRFKFVFA